MIEQSPMPHSPTGADVVTGVTDALVVSRLSIQFYYARPAVADVSLRVRRGEIVALVGESGSGKTMTARAAIGLLPDTARATGSVRVDGVEVLGLSEAELVAIRGSRVAMIFQEPQTALNPVRTIGWQLQHALRLGGRISRTQARRRAVELLELVEIPDASTRIDSFPHQLSGGQKQRVVIALALAGDPVLLLADEPTTALDVSVQLEILDLLKRLRDRTDVGILLITHNLGVVADIADSVVVVQFGEVVESGGVYDVFADPTHAYTRQLLASVPRLPAQTTVSRGHAERENRAPRHALNAASDTTDDAGPVATRESRPVAVHNIVVEHPGRFGGKAHTALFDVSLTVEPGQVVGVVGESGSGKTTLGRAIGGLIPVRSGSIVLDGHDIAALSARELRTVRRAVAFVPQDPTASLDPRFSVAESIREPLDIQGIGDASSRAKRVAELLSAVHLPTSFARRLPHELSGGQRQRVALARALSAGPRLLIADEPTSALDVSVQARVLTLFAELRAEFGFSAIFISHDLAVVEQVSDLVVVLRAGRIVESGSARAVLTEPQEPYTRQLIQAAPYPDPVIQRNRERAVAGTQ